MTTALNRRVFLQVGCAMAAALGYWPITEAARGSKIAVLPLNDRLALISGAGGNIVALHRPEGVLLVDSGATGNASKVQAALRGLAKGAKVNTVFNTHWHTDQTGGNDAFAKAGATIYAHAKTAQRMSVDQYLPKEDRYLPARQKAAVPTKVFYVGSKTLQVGAENIEYGYLLEAHTDGDIYVYFRDSNVLVVGDAAAPVSDPVLAWFEGGWLGARVDALSKLLTIGNDATRVIASTGAVVSKAELRTEHEALDTAFTRLSEAMRKGFTTEDMQKAKLLDGLPRQFTDPNKFIYDAHKGMWANHNKLSHQVV
jgi:cyclase